MVRSDLNISQARTAFALVERIDLSIDCAFEGSAGTVIADQPGEARVFMIEVGPFRYFSGDAGCPAARDAAKRLAPGYIVMPSAEGWFDLAKSLLGERIEEAPRWSFPSTGLDRATAASILRGSKDTGRVVRIDEPLVSSAMLADMLLDLSEYRGTEGFPATRYRIPPPEERQGYRDRVFFAVAPCRNRGKRLHQARLPTAVIWSVARCTSCRLVPRTRYPATLGCREPRVVPARKEAWVPRGQGIHLADDCR